MGVRKKPKVARGPKLIIEIRQPHTTITTGVRQPIGEALVADANETAMAGNPYREFENNCHDKKEATIALRIRCLAEAARIAIAATFLSGTLAGACTA
jgi:hypothetical protein